MFPECLATGAVRGPGPAKPMRDEYEMSTVNGSESLGAGKISKFFLDVK